MKLPPPVGWATTRAFRITTHLGVSWSDFCGQGRHPTVVNAREMVAYLLHTRKGPGCELLSFPDIAASIGRTNHSSVITAYRRVERSEKKVQHAEAIARHFGEFGDERAMRLPPHRWNKATRVA